MGATTSPSLRKIHWLSATSQEGRTGQLVCLPSTLNRALSRDGKDSLLPTIQTWCPLHGQSACKPIPKGNRCWRGGGELGPSLERSQTKKKSSSQGPFPRACPYYQVFLSVFDYLLEVINTLKEFLEAEFGNGLSLSSPICTHMHTYTHAHTHMHTYTNKCKTKLDHIGKYHDLRIDQKILRYVT